MLVYEAEVTAYAPLGTNGSITNTANVTDGNLGSQRVGNGLYG